MKKVKSKDGIASWKIDGAIERFLGKKADNSEFWKKSYVAFYKLFDTKYYKKGVKLIHKQVNLCKGEVDEKKLKYYITDMVYSLHRFGCMFDEYFIFGYENLNVEERERFITDKIRWQYYRQMNKDENLKIFNNKKNTYDHFKKYFKRELLEINVDTDKQIFCDFLDRHKKIIVKPIDGSGGKGIFILDKSQYESSEEAYKQLQEKSRTFVVEELIQQSAEMAQFHPSTVNTLRVPTVKTKEGVVVFHPCLRTGCGDSIVDNAFSGGIIAGISAETGVVITDGYNEKAQKIISHPDTNVIFKGFQIPRWVEAVEFVKQLANVIEDNNYVGWDIALTDAGWVLVEGNPRGQFIEQYATKIGVKKELEELIKKM